MNIQQFIDEISPMAIEDMIESVVLSSITIAQGMIESAHGNHAPGNNLFGIKSSDNSGQLLWTQEYVNGKWIQIQDWFRVYHDWSGSIADHSNFLRVNSRYTKAGFFYACSRLAYKDAANALHFAGYATDPSYANSLISVIEEYELYRFDREAVNNLQKIEDLEKKVAELNKLSSMPCPGWAREAVEAANKTIGIDGNPIVIEIDGGSYDFYRLISTLYRSGHFKK